MPNDTDDRHENGSIVDTARANTSPGTIAHTDDDGTADRPRNRAGEPATPDDPGR